MARVTIPELARAADVSVSTINRIIGGTGKVRPDMMERVLATAERIGFYGLGALQSRVAGTRPKRRLGILLQQPGRKFYITLGSHLEKAAAEYEGCEVDLEVAFLEDLSPDRVAERLLKLGEGRDGVAVVAADHPLVSEAIEQLDRQGVGVIGLITPLNAQCNVGFVGLDNWKVGRTAAWAFDHICKEPGKIGILVGSHRYRNQDQNEGGFRSYFREYGRNFTLLEPRFTFESSAVAREMTETLLNDHADLAGLYVSGGGITGALSALRGSGRAGKIVTVGYDLFDTTKAALIDGALTFLISHPFERLARETIESLVRCGAESEAAGTRRVLLSFEIYTRENL